MRRPRGSQLGLVLLVAQLFQVGLDHVPPVTLGVLGLNVYLYLFPAAPLMRTCVSVQYAYWHGDYRRLLLSPFHHVDDWHLYFNLTSFLWKGINLERRMGRAWFLYVLSVFSLLTGLVYLGLEAGLTLLTDDHSYSTQCAVGFSGKSKRLINGALTSYERLRKVPPLLKDFLSPCKSPEGRILGGSSLQTTTTKPHSGKSTPGVLFALKILSNHYNPGGVTYVLGLRVDNCYASWVELVLIHLTNPGTSLIGHLAGILVGLLYTAGPLKSIMKQCAALVTRPSRYSRPNHSYSGYSGTRDGGLAEGEYAGGRWDHTGGMTEQEQLDQALRNSMNDTGPRPGDAPPPPYGFHVSDEELRIRRLMRFAR